MPYNGISEEKLKCLDCHLSDNNYISDPSLQILRRGDNIVESKFIHWAKKTTTMGGK